MNTTYRVATNATLGLIFATGRGLTAYLIADSRGRLYWLFDRVVGVVTAVLALLRGPGRAWPVAAGLAGSWLSALAGAAGFTAVTVVNALTWLVAVALGITLRALGRAS